ncbi:MAG: hypothetical protein EOP67_76850, partial [Sphingomonas sp.]
MHARGFTTRTIAIVAACGGVGVGAEAAPRERVVLAIPAGRLDIALRQLATQTGQQILFDPRMTGRRKTAALHGPIEPDRALRTLLADTGLVAKHVRAGVIIIVAAPPARSPSAVVATASPAADIVVTALKRPTTLGDTEISMDAVTGAQVTARGAYDLRSAAALLPGLVPIAIRCCSGAVAIGTSPGNSAAALRRSYAPRAVTCA